MKKIPALINFYKEINEAFDLFIRFNALGDAEPILPTEIYLDDVVDKHGNKYQYIVSVDDEFYYKAKWGEKFKVIQCNEVIGHAVSNLVDNSKHDLQKHQ